MLPVCRRGHRGGYRTDGGHDHDGGGGRVADGVARWTVEQGSWAVPTAGASTGEEKEKLKTSVAAVDGC